MIADEQRKGFQVAVLSWFDREGRKDLPWQIEPTPYRVWVSEIMLQQTQVSTVIPYFHRFLKRFPGIQALAEASEDEVLGHWAGLGYYARARNLQKAAQIVQRKYAGKLPADVNSLLELPGIGRSTAGAILSLATGVRAPILDGNVKRVLSRYFAVEGWAGEPRIARELWRISEMLTPGERVGDYTQAMMDLGATLCTRNNPKCSLCPVRMGCQALRMELTRELPSRRPKKNIPSRKCWMLVLLDGEGAFFLQKRPPTGIWGGLWCFPQFEERDELEAWCQMRGIDIGLETLSERRHTFSHYHLDFTPVIGRVERPTRIGEACCRWLKPGETSALPAPVTGLMLELADESMPTTITRKTK